MTICAEQPEDKKFSVEQVSAMVFTICVLGLNTGLDNTIRPIYFTINLFTYFWETVIFVKNTRLEGDDNYIAADIYGFIG